MFSQDRLFNYLILMIVAGVAALMGALAGGLLVYRLVEGRLVVQPAAKFAKMPSWSVMHKRSNHYSFNNRSLFHGEKGSYQI